MAKRENGGLAFPRPSSPGDGSYSAASQQGMTLRDYFAAQVIERACAEFGFNAEAANRAYRIADMMLAERGE